MMTRKTCCCEVREIGLQEFDILAKPLFHTLQAEVKDRRWADQFNWAHFSMEWKRWVSLGIARTWYTEGAMLGGVFTEDLFSGAGRALVMFWAVDPALRGHGRAIHLLESFEMAAEEINADCAAAYHSAISPEHLPSIYINRGYKLRESIFVKGAE